LIPHLASGLNPVNPSDEGGIVEIGMRESFGELAAHRRKSLLSNEVRLV
jgi:hypothetical protein